ncbi:ribosomal protein S18 [Pseudomassariella vexata]|uniref:Small ribosomal subunit protein bS18m n=1 Tax=Pseudomassariella vexata TaxID=1141098 RepID=A0A1Y2EBJ4_9PEZI|nr:ribosomal protein S18 [Pseudomassariella vexata]ORY68787.1 ribosomal protein S18 [Pseudomassariella vexata]
MPPRIPYFSALRQPVSWLKPQARQISKTAAPQAIRDVPSASSNLLGLEPSGDPNLSRTYPIGNATKGVSNIFTAYNNERYSRMQPPAGERPILDALQQKNISEDFMRQMPRRWREGDLYAPHDLSPQEASKWRRVTTAKTDLVDMLGLRPLDMYRNFSFISEYMTTHGKIMRSEQTGLRPVNQRKVAKAIRRSIGMGLHPSVHRHPEILAQLSSSRYQQNAPVGKRTNHLRV